MAEIIEIMKQKSDKGYEKSNDRGRAFVKYQ